MARRLFIVAALAATTCATSPGVAAATPGPAKPLQRLLQGPTGPAFSAGLTGPKQPARRVCQAETLRGWLACQELCLDGRLGPRDVVRGPSISMTCVGVLNNRRVLQEPEPLPAVPA